MNVVAQGLSDGFDEHSDCCVSYVQPKSKSASRNLSSFRTLPNCEAQIMFSAWSRQHGSPPGESEIYKCNFRLCYLRLVFYSAEP
jgi:hypothetical protein